jgi:hypothetical protein
LALVDDEHRRFTCSIATADEGRASQDTAPERPMIFGSA